MMAPLATFAAQSSALSLLRSGGSGLFQPKQNLAARTASLLASLENPAAENAAQLLPRTQKSQNILQQMDTFKSDVNEQRKAAAAEKVQRIKQKLATLRLIASINPEAAAKQAAQLSRELTQAVREYSASGGNGGVSAVAASVVANTQAAGPEKSADMEAAIAPQTAEATTLEGEEPAAEESPQINPDALRQTLEDIRKEEEKDEQSFRGNTQEQISAPAERQAKLQADAQFAKDVEDVKNALRKILESVKRKLEEKENDSADQDIKDGESALQEVGLSLASVSFASIGSLVAPLNILA